jgi:hypothetical protein
MEEARNQCSDQSVHLLRSALERSGGWYSPPVLQGASRDVARPYCPRCKYIFNSSGGQQYCSLCTTQRQLEDARTLGAFQPPGAQRFPERTMMHKIGDVLGKMADGTTICAGQWVAYGINYFGICVDANKDTIIVESPKQFAGGTYSKQYVSTTHSHFWVFFIQMALQSVKLTSRPASVDPTWWPLNLENTITMVSPVPTPPIPPAPRQHKAGIDGEEIDKDAYREFMKGL